MLKYDVKVTKRHESIVDGFRLVLTEAPSGKVFVEIYKDKSYSNSAYFSVSSMDEAYALAQKAFDFFKENNPVLINAEDEEHFHSEH